MSLIVILDLPKIKLTVPGGKSPQTLVGAIITRSCSFKASSLVVTKSSPALLQVAAPRSKTVHFLILIAVLKAPIGVGGAGAGTTSEVSLNRLAVFVKFRAAFLCPMSALTTVQTIL